MHEWFRIVTLYLALFGLGSGSYCHNDCSGHGTCVEFQCQCDPGYHGEICNVQYSERPVLSVGHHWLTKRNFTKFVRQRETVLIGVSSTECAKCGWYEDQYHMALQEIGNKIDFARVDALHERELAKELKVEVLPSLVAITRKGKQRLVYRGEQTSEAIIDYVNKITKPALGVLQSKEELVRERKENHMIFAIAYFKSKFFKDLDEYNDLVEAAQEFLLNPNVYVLVSTNPEFAKAIGNGYLALFREDLDKPLNRLHLAEMNDGSIKDWVLQNSLPLVAEMLPENFDQYERVGLPMLLLFSHQPKSLVHHSTLVQVARRFRGKLSVLVVDAKRFVQHMTSLGIHSIDQWNVAASLNTNDGLVVKPILLKGRDLNANTLMKYCESYFNGNMEQYNPTKHRIVASKEHTKEVPDVKGVSEGFKRGTDSEVVTLSDANFSSTVFADDGRDVSILFYKSKACPACKHLIPYYKAAARRFTDLGFSPNQLLLARFDLSENDIPREFHLSSIPSIVMVPGNSRSPPYMFYSDTAKVALIMKWISRTASHGIQLPPLAHLTPEDQELFKEQMLARQSRNEQNEKEEL